MDLKKSWREKILSFTSHINIYPSDNLNIDDLKSIIDSDNNISGYSIVYRDEILISSSKTSNVPVLYIMLMKRLR